MIEIHELMDHEAGEWDEFVRRAPGGLPQHLSGWQRLLAEAGGHDTCYLLARREGQVVGVLPLFHVRSLLVGNTSMTMPGGLCALEQDVAEALVKRALSQAQEARMKQLMIQDSRQAWAGPLAAVSDHVYWTVDVSQGSEALWQSLHRNVRRQVRIARSNHLRVVIDRSGQELEAFYDVFSRFTHQTGTPVFGRKFLELAIGAFPNGFNIAIVRQGQEPIGGYFQLEMGDTIYGMWGASLPEYLDLRPTYLAYWEMLRDAADGGRLWLDMGRSPADSSASKFKAQWGGVSQPVYQLTAPVAGSSEANSLVRRVRQDRKMQLLVRVWPMLPLPLANSLGPLLRRHVPFA